MFGHKLRYYDRHATSDDLKELQDAYQAAGVSPPPELAKLAAEGHGKWTAEEKGLLSAASRWYDNESSNKNLALGGVTAMLENETSLEATKPSDYPQVLGNYISMKWGIRTPEFIAYTQIRDSSDGNNLLQFVYYSWAKNAYDDGYLSGLLQNTSLLQQAYDQFGGDAALGQPPTTLPPPPFRPPSQPSPSPPPAPKPQPPSTPTLAYAVVFGSVALVGAALYYAT